MTPTIKNGYLQFIVRSYVLLEIISLHALSHLIGRRSEHFHPSFSFILRTLFVDGQTNHPYPQDTTVMDHHLLRSPSSPAIIANNRQRNNNTLSPLLPPPPPPPRHHTTHANIGFGGKSKTKKTKRTKAIVCVILCFCDSLSRF